MKSILMRPIASVIIDSGNDLAPNRWQAIIWWLFQVEALQWISVKYPWDRDENVHWCIYGCILYLDRNCACYNGTVLYLQDPNHHLPQPRAVPTLCCHAICTLCQISGDTLILGLWISGFLWDDIDRVLPGKIYCASRRPRPNRPRHHHVPCNKQLWQCIHLRFLCYHLRG